MRYPYEIILGGYKEHPLMGQYLRSSMPDFDGMTTDEYWPALSTTENLFWRVAMTFNGDHPNPPVTLDELGRLDRDHMWRFCSALIVSRQNLSLKAWREWMGDNIDFDAAPEGR